MFSDTGGFRNDLRCSENQQISEPSPVKILKDTTQAGQVWVTSRKKVKENLSCNDPAQIRAEKTQAAQRVTIRPPGLGLESVKWGAVLRSWQKRSE